MSADNGLGAITQKNQIILQDTLTVGGLTATRHANGRDWWVLVFEYNSKKYYSVLVTDEGISVAGSHSIDVKLEKSQFGQFVFSPDGSRFVATSTGHDLNQKHFVEIFDFNRCTGTLSNRKRVYYSQQYLLVNSYQDDFAQGAAISPNSRYLYLSLFKRVFQIDMEAAAPQQSLTLVADFDGFKDDYFITQFGMAWLGPDGHIYMNTSLPTKYLHRFEQPNDPGAGCRLEQQKVELPGLNWYTMPNHPNYRLQPLAGSGCDTLGVERPVYILGHPYPEEGCIGGTAHFEVTAFGNGLSYQWQASSNGGITWSAVLENSNQTGVYSNYLTLHNLNAVLNGFTYRCVVSGDVSTEISRPATLSVIGSVPVAAFNYTQDLDSVVFDNLTTGAEHYKWYFGDGDTSVLEHPNHLYKYSGDFAPVLVATNACGQDTTVLQPALTVDFTADFVADDTFGCAPFTVKYRSKSPYRTRNHVYLMPGGVPNVRTGFREVETIYEQPGVYDVELRIFSPPPYYEKDTLVKHQYVTVVVGVNPVVNILAQQSGDTIQLHSNFNLGDTYTWHISNGDSLSGQSVQYIFPVPGVYSVVLDITNMCGTRSDTMQFVAGEPEAAFSHGPAAGCAPLTVQFDNTTAFPLDSVRWFFAGGVPAVSESFSPGITYPNTGTFDVMMIAFAGGLSDTLLQTAVVSTWADACPSVQLFTQTNGLEVTSWTDCLGGGVSYVWDFGNGVAYTSSAVTHSFDTAGTYGIQLIVHDLCGNDTLHTTVTVENPVSVIGGIQPAVEAFHVWPNPASSEVEILAEKVSGPVTFRLLDNLGKNVLFFENETWTGRCKYSISHLAPGIYFYEITLASGYSQPGKLVIGRE